MEGPTTCEDGLCTQKFVHSTYPSESIEEMHRNFYNEGYQIFGEERTQGSWCRQYVAEHNYLWSNSSVDFFKFQSNAKGYFKGSCPMEYTQFSGGLMDTGADGVWTQNFVMVPVPPPALSLATTTMPYPADHIQWGGSKDYHTSVWHVNTKTDNYCYTQFWKASD